MGADVAVGPGIADGKEVGPEVAARLGVEVGVGWGVPSAPQAASTIPAIASKVTRAMSGRTRDLPGGVGERPVSEDPLDVLNPPFNFMILSTLLYSLQRPGSSVKQKTAPGKRSDYSRRRRVEHAKKANGP